MSKHALSTGLVVWTRLAPPRLPRHTLPRPRLTRLLRDAQHYRLTLLHAGTGYGKSTALAALSAETDTLAWYHLEAEDGDPQVFLLHLYHALQTAVSRTTAAHLSVTPLALLEQWEQNPAVWTAVTDTLVNELTAVAAPVTLILDDAHRLNPSAAALRILDRLIGRAPPNLHLLLATRYPLQLPTLLTWRVRGDLLEIDQSLLAFTPAEIAALFRQQYGYPLDAAQTDLLAARSEGWPIALHLVWQRLSGGAVTLDDALGQLSGGALFAYLAQEVLAQQPPDVQQFLRETAVLRQMTTETCDALRDADDSQQLLQYLHENGLFVVTLGDGHRRYHHLVRELIYRQLPPDTARAGHLKAAAIYQAQAQPEEALHHMLAAGAFEQAAAELAQRGRLMVQAGRLDTLAGWIGRVPPDMLLKYPALLVYLGDIARLRSQFDKALAWYQQAEAISRSQGQVPGISQALRGQARVYLDTVNPSQAERLLQEALRLTDGQADRASRARLLDLLAENLLNQGRVDEAESYRQQAQALRQEGPGEAELSIRVLLRTGQLAQARRLLEKQVARERQEPVLRPRAHRETLLLLSLILAMQGEADAAYACAVEGTERGHALNSPFVTAVGYMRQGHARLLQKNEAGYVAAARHFRQAIEVSDSIDVQRLKVEAYWGLCQAVGFHGQLTAALETAVAGITLAQTAGDEWVTACIRTTMGAAYALAGQTEQALFWLTQAMTAFRDCGDTYGEAVCLLWHCLIWHTVDDTTRLARDLNPLLELVQQHNYDYLFLRPTLLGPPDPRALVPLLLVARERAERRDAAAALLVQLGLDQLDSHPGYQLRLQLLGPFRAWRGQQEIAPGDWKRQKARQLFLLLLTYRGALLEREQIGDLLWPDLDPDSAQRDFKIAYSALLTVLEPARGRHAPSAYVVRDGTRYGLRADADLWLDVAEFEAHAAAGDALYERQPAAAGAFYQQAVALYGGDYLAEFPFEEWSLEPRERLLTRFLQTAERLAGLLLDAAAWEEAIRLAQTILAHDDCWEQAYRVQMQAYVALGQRAQAARAYQQCVERLQADVGVPPSQATTDLYQTLLGNRG